MNKIDVGTHSSIAWNDTWHRIDVNHRRVTLSPTQYRICRAFLSASKSSKAFHGDIIIVAYRSSRELQTETELPHPLLIKHMSNLNARLMSIGLHVCPFRFASSGYILAYTDFKQNSL